jgi:hypothetical protein
MDDLERALAEERALILAGRPGGLGAALPRAEARDARAARRLLALARHNRRLLLAALEGLRDAAGRRAATAEARGRLGTYDARGARAAEPAPAPRVERRA